MTNAEKFKEIFGIYATEFWAKSEKDMLNWLNETFQERYNFNNSNTYYYGESFSFSYPCSWCANNPKNGGTGVCNCTLGTPKVY